MELEKPDLCAPAPDGRRLELRAARCGTCHGLSFPKTDYGCPLCGAPAEAVAEERLDGRATLLSFATIHTKLAPTLSPPLTVGEAEIAPGIIEEVELTGGEGLTVGMVIEAVAHEVERGGEPVIAIRFAPVAGA